MASRGRPRRRDTTIEAAKLTVVGTLLAAVIGLVGDVATRDSSPPPPPPAPVAVNCTTEVDRFDRFVGDDPTRVIMLTGKGANGVAPLEMDTGAKACGIDGDDLESMVNQP